MMVGNTTVGGTITLCMVLAFIIMLMAKYTKGSLNLTKRQGMASIAGRTTENMRAGSSKVNNMDSGCTKTQKEAR